MHNDDLDIIPTYLTQNKVKETETHEDSKEKLKERQERCRETREYCRTLNAADKKLKEKRTK